MSNITSILSVAEAYAKMAKENSQNNLAATDAAQAQKKQEPMGDIPDWVPGDIPDDKKKEFAEAARKCYESDNTQFDFDGRVYKITEKLVGNQDKLDVNNNGKIDGDDLAALRSGKKPANESHFENEVETPGQTEYPGSGMKDANDNEEIDGEDKAELEEGTVQTTHARAQTKHAEAASTRATSYGAKDYHLHMIAHHSHALAAKAHERAGDTSSNSEAEADHAGGASYHHDQADYHLKAANDLKSVKEGTENLVKEGEEEKYYSNQDNPMSRERRAYGATKSYSSKSTRGGHNPTSALTSIANQASALANNKAGHTKAAALHTLAATGHGLESPQRKVHQDAAKKHSDTAAGLKEDTNNPTDTLTIDIPAMIRALEKSREDFKSDEDIHNFVQNLLKKKDTAIDTNALPKNESVNEAHKLGDKVKIISGPKDVQGKTGRIGEIRHGLHKTADKTYTVDYDGGSIQLQKKHIRAFKENTEKVNEATVTKKGVEEAVEPNSLSKNAEDATKAADHATMYGSPMSASYGRDGGSLAGLHLKARDAHHAAYDHHIAQTMKVSQNSGEHSKAADHHEKMAGYHNDHLEALGHFDAERRMTESSNPTDKLTIDTNALPKNESVDYHAAAMSASAHAKKQPSATTHKAASDAHDKAIAWHEKKVNSLIKKDGSADEVKKHEDHIKMHKNEAQKHRFNAHRLGKSQKNESVTVAEKLDPNADAGVWISDFVNSTDPRFDGKSKEERKQQALAAWYAARRDAGIKESTDMNNQALNENVAGDPRASELTATANQASALAHSTAPEAGALAQHDAATKAHQQAADHYRIYAHHAGDPVLRHVAGLHHKFHSDMAQHHTLRGVNFSMDESVVNEGAPADAKAGPEVMDPKTKKMKDQHDTNVKVEDAPYTNKADGSENIVPADKPKPNPTLKKENMDTVKSIKTVADSYRAMNSGTVAENTQVNEASEKREGLTDREHAFSNAAHSASDLTKHHNSAAAHTHAAELHDTASREIGVNSVSASHEKKSEYHAKMAAKLKSNK